MAVDQIPALPERQRAIKVVEASSLRLEKDVPLPEIEDEDVLVRVHCVALNPFDWYYSLSNLQTRVSRANVAPGSH